jgi:hypothetical protein
MAHSHSAMSRLCGVDNMFHGYISLRHMVFRCRSAWNNRPFAIIALKVRMVETASERRVSEPGRASKDANQDSWPFRIFKNCAPGHLGP